MNSQGARFQACSRHATLDQGYRHDLQRPRRLDRQQRAPGRRARSRPCRAHRRRPGRPAPARGDALPPLWQWAFFISAVSQDGLGTDGHPSRGGFLPPRMTATECGPAAGSNSSGRSGSACRPSASTVADVRKRPAARCAAVRHRAPRIPPGRRGRDPGGTGHRLPPAHAACCPGRAGARGAVARPGRADFVLLLFGVTFNGHRIHYDHPYVTTVEGYPGLVHGP